MHLLLAGNVFVIAAIILERNLQNVANYLVASLAVADLFVACLVMPLGAVYEVSSYSCSCCYAVMMLLARAACVPAGFVVAPQRWLHHKLHYPNGNWE